MESTSQNPPSSRIIANPHSPSTSRTPTVEELPDPERQDRQILDSEDQPLPFPPQSDPPETGSTRNRPKQTTPGCDSFYKDPSMWPSMNHSSKLTSRLEV